MNNSINYLDNAVKASKEFIQASAHKGAASEGAKSKREAASLAAFMIALHAPQDEKKLRELIAKDGELNKAKAPVSMGFSNAEFLQQGGEAQLGDVTVTIKNHGTVMFTQSSLYKVALAARKEAKAINALADIEAERITKAIKFACDAHAISAAHYQALPHEEKQALIAFGMDKVMSEEAELAQVAADETALATVEELKTKIAALPQDAQLALADWIVSGTSERKAA